jgi:hypothetical protein
MSIEHETMIAKLPLSVRNHETHTVSKILLTVVASLVVYITLSQRSEKVAEEVERRTRS